MPLNFLWFPQVLEGRGQAHPGSRVTAKGQSKLKVLVISGQCEVGSRMQAV